MIIADGYYPNIAKFEMPWPHYIIDDFLDENVYKTLIDLRKNKNFEFVDNGEVPLRLANKPSKQCLPIYKNEELKSLVQSNIDRKLSGILPEKYFCMPDLIKCDPGYVYNKHKDHKIKRMSIVVYLHPTMSNATTLIDNQNRMYNIAWRCNRALIFNQETHGLHYYYNNTAYPRLTLNVYISETPVTGFQVIPIIMVDK